MSSNTHAVIGAPPPTYGAPTGVWGGCTCGPSRVPWGTYGKIPGYGHLGQEDSAATEGHDSFSMWLKAGTVAMETLQDPYQRAAILEQRLVTLRNTGVAPTNWFYRRTEAQLAAAQREIGHKQEERTAILDTAQLGQVGIGVGAVVGISLAALILVAAMRLGRG